MRSSAPRHARTPARALPVLAAGLVSALVGSVIGCGGATTSRGSNDAGREQMMPDASEGAVAEGASRVTFPDSGSAVDDGGRDAMAQDGGSPACTIVATSYDQSCMIDSDCVEVTTGNYCTGPQCMCGGSAISARAAAQFNADVARVHDGGFGIACPCPPPFGPCCRSGTCTAQCWSPSDTLPACAHAGGACAPPNAACGSAGGAPRVLDGGCAFPDEMCCL